MIADLLAALMVITCLDGTMGEGRKLRRVLFELTSPDSARIHMLGRETRTLPLILERQGDTTLSARTTSAVPESIKASVQLHGNVSALRGTISFRGVTHPLELREASPATSPWALGSFVGVTRASGFPLQVGVRTILGPCGVLHGWVDTPEQRQVGLPLTSASVEPERAVLRAGYLGLQIELLRRGEGVPPLAVLAQGGLTDTFALEPGDLRTAARRPQEPSPPVPYAEREVSVRSGTIDLHGTYTHPSTPGRHPAALLIGGSGPQDRDESVAGHRPFLVLADHLTRAGLAVLRLDDRGVGRSGGSTLGATIGDLADDALAAIDWLAARRDVDPFRIVLVGHSEGGYVALRASRLARGRRHAPAGLVTLNGPSVPGDELLRSQFGASARADGASAADIRVDSLLLAACLRGVGRDTRGSAQGLVASVEREIHALKRSLAPADRAVLDSVLLARSAERDSTMLALWNTRWFRSFVAHDPRTDLLALTAPLLALHGSLDAQVPSAPSTSVLRGVIARRRADIDVRTLPRLNHLLQTATSGSLSEYSRIEETMAPVALDAILGFLRRITTRRPPPSR